MLMKYILCFSIKKKIKKINNNVLLNLCQQHFNSYLQDMAEKHASTKKGLLYFNIVVELGWVLSLCGIKLADEFILNTKE